MQSPLPDDARLWVFSSLQPLSPQAVKDLERRIASFLERWASHGRAVPGDVTVLHDRFLVVAAHLAGGVSGCGIDSLVHAVEEVGSALGVTWADGLHLAYRDAHGAVQVVPRPIFRGLVRDGTVTAETPVFVTTLETIGDLRAGGLERPAGETWHGRTFRIPQAA